MQQRARFGLILVAWLICVLSAVGAAQAQGACCGPGASCQPAADEAECNTLNGVFLDGEDCANDPCVPAACCNGLNCGIADAFSCETAGRVYAGAGVTCLDDPCEADIGACCNSGGCTYVSPGDCSASGGVWQGAGTDCLDPLCGLGSCCSPGNCVEEAHFECNASGGSFIDNGDCVTDVCEVPNDCALNSLFSQSRDQPEFFTAYTSEASSGFKRYEDFSGVIGSIDSLKWWGLDQDFDDGDFIECTELNPTFAIAFHEDLAGAPGAAVCSYTLLATRTDTGIFYQGSQLNEYEVALPTSCVLVSGWVSLQGLGDPECWFQWMSSIDGNSRSYCDNCQSEVEGDDLSVCIGGETGGVLGSCCNQSNGSCTDNVEIQNCVAPGLRFTHDTACAEIDPPCSAENGACCFDTGVCFQDLPDACTLAGGNWLGAGVSCDVCPAVGACCFDADSCFIETEPACDALGRTWLGVATRCDECPETPECPVGSLYEQSPDDPSDFIAGTSEITAGFLRSDDFAAVDGAVESLNWWGLDMELVGANFIECVESTPEFDIRFREDAGGVPGAEVCSYTLSSSYAPTGLKYLGAELNAYGVTLPTPCVLVNGWVEIVGLGDSDCWFLWVSSDQFGSSHCEGCTPEPQDFDVNFCLGGTTGGVFGACCDDTTAQCSDNTEITQCLGAQQRFVPGQTCDSLDPACGIILGACCQDDGSCTRVEQDTCQAAGGSWLGANTLCDQCPCVVNCPQGGLPEGETPCGDDYIDTFNGGCNAALQNFSPISFGDTVCGESGVFLENGQTSQADFDWYELSVTEPTEIVWSAEAEFPPRLWIYNGNAGCPGLPIASNSALDCDDLTIDVQVQPGTFWLVIQPAGFTDTTTCPSPYTATVTQNSLTLTLNVDPDQVHWNVTGGALSYDVVRGDLAVLRSTSGDFTPATEECLADNTPDTFVSYPSNPQPGEGYWFLARPNTLAGPGTYDSTGVNQAEFRDPEIFASPNACPQ